MFWSAISAVISVGLISVTTGDLNCSAVFEDFGTNQENLIWAVGHATHSMTLEDLQHHFEPNTPIENGVHTCNSNFTSDQVLLPNAPQSLRDEERTLMTQGMINNHALRMVNYMIVNEKAGYPFVIQGANLLEKIEHQLHMLEINLSAAEAYKYMLNNPPSEDFCSCAQSDPVTEKLDVYLHQLGVGFRCFKLLNNDMPDEGLTEAQVCGDEADPVAVAEQKAKIASDEGLWKVGTLEPGPDMLSNWHKILHFHSTTVINEQDPYDIAAFMYCKLHKFANQ